LETTAVEGVIYQGANLVARSVAMGKPIAFVSTNYRLNAFGGLASQEITDAGVANLHLKDQRVAMQWVQKYISEVSLLLYLTTYRCLIR
jgi:acetylcholinesterase